MGDLQFLLVDVSVLPETFASVIRAKQLLAEGTAKSASEAARMAGISRSVFYKYKDRVFPYNERTGRIITLSALLYDKPGVLSGLINALSKAGANILTLNQNIPVGGFASVSVSARVERQDFQVNEVLQALGQLEGIKSIEQILGE